MMMMMMMGMMILMVVHVRVVCGEVVDTVRGRRQQRGERREGLR